MSILIRCKVHVQRLERVKCFLVSAFRLRCLTWQFFLAWTASFGNVFDVSTQEWPPNRLSGASLHLVCLLVHCEQSLQVRLAKSGRYEQTSVLDDESIFVNAEVVPLASERFQVLSLVDFSFWPTILDDRCLERVVLVVLMRSQFQKTFVA